MVQQFVKCVSCQFEKHTSEVKPIVDLDTQTRYCNILTQLVDIVKRSIQSVRAFL